MDDRAFRIGVLLSAHLMFLSAAALRILRGHREHRLVAESPWWIQYYPPLVWLPFLVAYIEPMAVDLDQSLQLIGLAIAAPSAAFGAWAMWTLGKNYGIKLDIFEGHELITTGPYAVVRHPMYLGIVLFHVGASLAMQSPLLLFATLGLIVPFTAIRLTAEEKALTVAFPEHYPEYQHRVPALLPRP